jgi:spermidine synthase
MDHAVKNNRSYDIIYLDAFDSFSVPYHLTTSEFHQKLFSALKPGGLFIANCVDIFSVGKFLNAYINTVASVFPHVYVCEDANSLHTSRSTFVVVGSLSSMDIEELYYSAHKRIGHIVSDEDLKDLQRRNGNLILSDKHAPVEKLIGPVFLEHIR